MHYKRIFSIPDYSLSFKITSVSHPWAYFATCFQSHTSVCSFQQVTKSTPRLRPLRLRNFKECALIIFFSLLCSSIGASASSPRYIALADSADMLIKSEKWDEAEKTILTALRLEPGNFTNAMLLSNLGIARTNLGKTEEAIEAFNLGLDIAPRSSIIRNNRARTYIMAGRYDDALSDLNESLEIDSLQLWTRRMRGLLLLNRNDIDGARKDFNAAISLYPRDASSLSGLARACELEGDMKGALEKYDRSIEIEDNPETRFSRILLKINMGDYSAASADITDAIKCFPEVPDFFIARGYHHRLNFLNEEAKIDKKIALDKGADPQFVDQFIPENGK